jgi:hypothetical protein
MYYGSSINLNLSNKGNLMSRSYEASPIQCITWRYSLRHSRKVQKFLEENFFLVPLLIEARHYISKYFPASATFLDVETDPEEKTKQLVALIATNLSPDDAYRQLKQLDEDWWLGALSQAQMKLCISVEFK